MKSELGVEQEAQQNRRAGLERPVGADLGGAAHRRPGLPQPGRLQPAPAVLVSLALRGRRRSASATPPRASINRFPRRIESSGTACGCDGTGECTDGTRRPPPPLRPLRLPGLQQAAVLRRQQDARRAQLPAQEPVLHREGDPPARPAGRLLSTSTTASTSPRPAPPSTRTIPAGAGPLRLVDRHRRHLPEQRQPQRLLAAHPPPDHHPGPQLRLGQGRKQRRRHR